MPLTELRSSLDLVQRSAALSDAGPAVFADDHLLDLACSADPTVRSELLVLLIAETVAAARKKSRACHHSLSPP